MISKTQRRKDAILLFNDLLKEYSRISEIREEMIRRGYTISEILEASRDYF